MHTKFFDASKKFFVLIVVSLTMACNSASVNPETENEKACNNYNYYYENLQPLVQAIKTHSKFEYDSYEIWGKSTIEDIRVKIANLDSIKCNSKKNIDFSFHQISAIQDHINNEKKLAEQEVSNGDDLFMNCVKISTSKILFDDNMAPYIEMTLLNDTTKNLRAFKFLVNYCLQNDITPLCYKMVLIKE